MFNITSFTLCISSSGDPCWDESVDIQRGGHGNENRTVSEFDMDKCTDLKTYDYFNHSENSYALTFAAVGLWIVGELERVFYFLPIKRIKRIPIFAVYNCNNRRLLRKWADIQVFAMSKERKDATNVTSTEDFRMSLLYKLIFNSSLLILVLSTHEMI